MWQVTCMIRCRDKEEARQRLRDRWKYYFGDTSLGSYKIDIVYGDLTDPSSIRALADHHFDVVVNCAADIRYFAKDDNIHRVNEIGVEHLAQTCIDTNATLIHISTLSVSGFDAQGGIPTLTPQQLFFHQHFIDQYSKSKFMAERHLLEKMAHGKLKGTVIRLGHLMPSTISKKPPLFATEDLLTAALHAMRDMGAVPATARHIKVGAVDVDLAAARIEDIISAPTTRPVWHVGDENSQSLKDLAERLAAKPLPETSDNSFVEHLPNTPHSQLLIRLFEAITH